MISQYEHGHVTLAQTDEYLKIGQEALHTFELG